MFRLGQVLPSSVLFCSSSLCVPGERGPVTPGHWKLVRSVSGPLPSFPHTCLCNILKVLEACHDAVCHSRGGDFSSAWVCPAADPGRCGDPGHSGRRGQGPRLIMQALSRGEPITAGSGPNCMWRSPQHDKTVADWPFAA